MPLLSVTVIWGKLREAEISWHDGYGFSSKRRVAWLRRGQTDRLSISKHLDIVAMRERYEQAFETHGVGVGGPDADGRDLRGNLAMGAASSAWPGAGP
jgi:hypothetical protein